MTVILNTDGTVSVNASGSNWAATDASGAVPVWRLKAKGKVYLNLNA